MVRTPAMLKLLPMPRSSGAAGVRDKLPSRLIIMHSDGSLAPKEARNCLRMCLCLCLRCAHTPDTLWVLLLAWVRQHVVHMARDAKKRELLAQALLLSGADPQTEQIVIAHTDTRVKNAVNGELAACAVRDWIAGVHIRSAGMAGYGGAVYFFGNTDDKLDEKLPRCAAFFLSLCIPPGSPTDLCLPHPCSGTRLAGTYPTFFAFRMPVGKFVAVHLRRIGSVTMTHKRARDVRMYGRTSELRTKMPQGIVALLPMPHASKDGGTAAEAELRASLQRFMVPFMKPAAQYAAPLELMHSHAGGTWTEQLSMWHMQDNETPYFTVREPTVKYGNITAEMKAEMLRYAGADWTAQAFDSLFDVDAMVTPQDRDASAVADRAGELDLLQHEWEEQRSKTRAAAVSAELRTASEVTWQVRGANSTRVP
jgi:hypothetical protein